MTMVRINTSEALVLVASEEELKPGKVRGEEVTDREGRTLYRVWVLIKQEDLPPQLVQVTVPGQHEFPISAPVRLEGLRATSWEREGRQGIAWRADAIECVGGPSADQRGNGLVAQASKQQSTRPGGDRPAADRAAAA